MRREVEGSQGRCAAGQLMKQTQNISFHAVDFLLFCVGSLLLAVQGLQSPHNPTSGSQHQPNCPACTSCREPLLQDGGEKFGPSSSLPLPNDLTGLKSITGGEVAEKLVSWRPLMGYTILFVVAFLAIAAMSVAILEYVPADHHKPECRKSSALAVLPGAGAGIATMELLVWSGMARNRTPLADLHTYGVATRRWQTVGTSDAGVPFWRQRAPKAPAPAPLPRWKAGTGQVVGSRTGMLVFGGDAFLPTGDAFPTLTQLSPGGRK
jgi:hypothetical protein